MKIIKKQLGNFEKIEIHVFADEHIGDSLSDMQRLKERIEYVKNTPNAFCIMNGDILDFATKLSIGDIEARQFNIMEQIQKGIDWFGCIKEKILCITAGNHEMRAYNKEGIDVTRLLAMQLGLIDYYSSESIYLFLYFGELSREKSKGRKTLYTFYINHGRGGGRKEGAKVIRLADMASIVDADVYIHSHTHLPVIMKNSYFRPSLSNRSIEQVTRLFVNTGSNLNYGGYGEVAEFKPTAKETPVIYLNGTKKEAKAKL